MSDLQIVLLEPAKVMLVQIGQFVGNVFLVVFVLLVGWLLSWLIKASISKGLKALKIDDLSDRIELSAILAKGGMKYTLSELIAVICYWLALLVTFVVALGTVNLTPSSLLDKIVSYIPNIITTIFVIILGMFVSRFLGNVVQTAASNAGLEQSRLLSKIVEIVVTVFVVLISLEQLNIGARVIELTITITLASIGLAFALAFGFGCRDAAEKCISEFVDKLKKK